MSKMVHYSTVIKTKKAQEIWQGIYLGQKIQSIKKKKDKKKKESRIKERSRDMARSISYVTGSQLLSIKRRPNIAIIDVRYSL